jgi:hypothetical protein
MRTVDDLIHAVDSRLLSLRKEGGQLELPTLTWDGDQNNTSRTLRLSASGKCGRQLAYAMHYPEEREALTSRALNVFALGDVIHAVERALISQVTELQAVERRVYFDVTDEIQVAGHIDGIITVNGEPMILDIKSINTRGFKEVVEGEVRPDYQAQLQAYLDASGVSSGVLWFYNKDTSHRHATVLKYNKTIVREVRERFQRVINSTPSDLPDREYKAQAEVSRGKMTGREYLPWQCGYCPFVERCWSSQGFKMEMERGKPRWIR